MRTTVNTHIQDVWDAGGPLVGDFAAAHGRITVEVGWSLRESLGATIGSTDKFYNGPVRWFQRTDNSQVETEIPNIMTIDIDRHLTNDAATCKFVMLNTLMKNNVTAANASLLVPAYSYPSPLTFWDTLGASTPSVSALIANANSGPGSTPDANYVLAINAALAFGIHVYGYVDTNYGAVSSATVTANVALWKSFYGVTSIFFDRVSSSSAQLAYYQTVCDFTHEGGGRVTLNPGTPPDEGYMTMADNVVIFEGTYTNYLPFSPPPWVFDYPASHFTHIVHDCTTSPNMQTALLKSQAQNAGNIYITDDATYGTLPAYFATEVADVLSGGVQGESVGLPGYYFPTFGDSPAAKARWGWTINAWNDVIQPNALLRTYQGYGGKSLTVTAAVAAGNILQTGLWLVDDVSMDAQTGQMTVSCRDMAKLLIQQQLYPPLVPLGSNAPPGPFDGQGLFSDMYQRFHYPLYFHRWTYVNHPVVPYGPSIYHTGFVPRLGNDQPNPGSPPAGASGPSPLTVHIATSDLYPTWASSYAYQINDIATSNGVMYICIAASTGNPPTTSPGFWSILHDRSMAIDGNPDTYWMSNGHIASRGNDEYEFIEFDIPVAAPPGAPVVVQGVNIQPYAGNYEMYISIYAGGWLGTGPLDIFGGMINSGSTVYTGAYTPDIPYVRKLGVGWEQAITVDLSDSGGVGYTQPPSGPFRIRFTFTHLAKTSITPAPYRCGIREVQIGTFASTVMDPSRTINGIANASNKSPYGYWICGSDGNVYGFGGAELLGSEGGKTINAPIVDMAGNPETGEGYRLLGEDGGVFDFGDTYYHGSLPGLGVALTGNHHAVSICNGDQGHSGYYVLVNTGEVYAFGTAGWHGNYAPLVTPVPAPFLYGVVAISAIANGYFITDTLGNVQAKGAAVMPGGYSPPALDAGEIIVDIESTSDGADFWVLTSSGRIYHSPGAFWHGNAPLMNTPPNTAFYNVHSSSMVRSSTYDKMTGIYTDNGYWITDSEGGVYARGSTPPALGPVFSGSLPQQYTAVGDGNYLDYTDIVTDMLLWAGFWYRNPALGDATPPNVFGILESTGIYAPDNLTEDFFDQKPIIDVINTLKEIVGFITFADEIGAYHFQTPNFWSIGNFLDTGQRTSAITVIDEEIQITDYVLDMNDTDARSQIIIATEDPALRIPGTESVTITSQWGGEVLRGLVIPALWVNGQFLTTEVQQTMAELIDLHLFFQQRQGSVTMLANPTIQIDDQVQIFERSTSETYVHYVAGYTTSMDLQAGTYYQTLTTHWMGDGASWFLNYGLGEFRERAWSALASYVVGDLVSVGNVNYVCVANNTNQMPPNVSYWNVA